MLEKLLKDTYEIKEIKPEEISKYKSRLTELAIEQGNGFYNDFEKNFSYEDLKEIAGNNYLIGAFDKEEIVGFTLGKRGECGENLETGYSISGFLEPYVLVVDKNHRKKGLGEKLLSKVIENGEKDELDIKFIAKLEEPDLMWLYVHNLEIPVTDSNTEYKNSVRGIFEWNAINKERPIFEPKNLKEYKNKVNNNILTFDDLKDNYLTNNKIDDFVLEIDKNKIENVNNSYLNETFNDLIKNQRYILTDVYKENGLNKIKNKIKNKDGKYYYRFESRENLMDKANICKTLNMFETKKTTYFNLLKTLGTISKNKKELKKEMKKLEHKLKISKQFKGTEDYKRFEYLFDDCLEGINGITTFSNSVVYYVNTALATSTIGPKTEENPLGFSDEGLENFDKSLMKINTKIECQKIMEEDYPNKLFNLLNHQ